ncbi:MAG TPA: hypothetical protein PLR65_09450 [Anaerolineales bacterium]|nr:hypothetical protein [Anaerolineales bacterium]
MKRPILIILSVALAFVLVGSLLMNIFGLQVGRTYSTINYALPGYGGGGASDVLFAPPAPEELASAPIQPLSDQAQTSLITQSQECMGIQNAEPAIVVADPQTRMSGIEALAKGMGGFVVSSNLYTPY